MPSKSSSKLFLTLLGATVGFFAGYKALQDSEVAAAEKTVVDYRQVRLRPVNSLLYSLRPFHYLIL